MNKIKKSIKGLLKSIGLDVKIIRKNGITNAPALTKNVDISMVELLKNSNVGDLKNKNYLVELLLKMGLNDEVLGEFPKELYKHTGKGLFSWQYPTQFSDLLIKLSEYPINTYMEIGVRHGGTFIIIYEYLKKLNENFKKAIAVDISESATLKSLASKNSDVEYIICDTHSEKFKNYVDPLNLDLIFIDGDHTLEGCLEDFNLIKDKCNMIIFHDIVNLACPGVCAVWNHFKSIYEDIFEFYEYTYQYNEVYQRTGGSYLGIGLAVRKN